MRQRKLSNGSGQPDAYSVTVVRPLLTIQEMDMNNIYKREDYEINGMYRVMTYAECLGYWSTSELMTEEEANELIKLYGDGV